MERVAPEPPRVSDIVAEAGSSNKAFYRYFAGKDELILAVMERGVGIVVSYLQHQMAKESKPQHKIACWIEGTLAQVADPQLTSKSRAAAEQMPAGVNWLAADQEMLQPVRDLLIEPVTALGSRDVGRDVEAVFCCTAATLRRYVHSAHRLGPDDIAHVVGFCLRGLGVS